MIDCSRILGRVYFEPDSFPDSWIADYVALNVVCVHCSLLIVFENFCSKLRKLNILNLVATKLLEIELSGFRIWSFLKRRSVFKFRKLNFLHFSLWCDAHCCTNVEAKVWVKCRYTRRKVANSISVWAQGNLNFETFRWHFQIGGRKFNFYGFKKAKEMQWRILQDFKLHTWLIITKFHFMHSKSIISSWLFIFGLFLG